MDEGGRDTTLCTVNWVHKSPISDAWLALLATHGLSEFYQEINKIHN